MAFSPAQRTRLQQLSDSFAGCPPAIWLVQRYRSRNTHTHCIGFQIIRTAPAPRLISIGRDVAYIFGVDYDITRDGVVLVGRGNSPAILVRMLSRELFGDDDVIAVEWI